MNRHVDAAKLREVKFDSMIATWPWLKFSAIPEVNPLERRLWHRTSGVGRSLSRSNANSPFKTHQLELECPGRLTRIDRNGVATFVARQHSGNGTKEPSGQNGADSCLIRFHRIGFQPEVTNITRKS
jgi:hypothetical protein